MGVSHCTFAEMAAGHDELFSLSTGSYCRPEYRILKSWPSATERRLWPVALLPRLSNWVAWRNPCSKSYAMEF